MITKEDYYRRKAAKEAERNKKVSESWRAKAKDPMIWFTGLLAIFTLGLVYVAYLTDHTLRDTLESNEATQRAFVFAKGLRIDNQKMPLYWQFDVIAENSGNTPTREMEYLTISNLNDPKDPEDIFIRTPKSVYDEPATFPQRRSGDLIGPKAEIALVGSHSGLPYSAVTKMAEERKNWYISGVIHYRDVFRETRPYVTKFCYIAIPYKAGTETRVSYERCLYWNCADEDCKRDRERYDYDFKAINSKPAPPK
jgi:hypothetical protein